jgi:hypothetical protein
MVRFNLLFSLFILTVSLPGQSLFDRLYHPEATAAVHAVLTLPVDSLTAERESEQDAFVSFRDGQGQDWQFAINISVRGKFRRSRCENPPLKLDLDKDELTAAGLDRHDKFKLVVPCYSDTAATNLLLREYLAYRAYALVSPGAHYRAQLLRLTFRDAYGAHPDRTEYAFIIEDTDEMAARSGGSELDRAIGLPAERFDPLAEATHALWQYLVGNGDWSLPLHRNVKVVELGNGLLVPVAYDFDFSGWVGAPYASPTRSSGQESIYERVYLGYQQSERTLREVSTAFRSQRRPLLQLVANFDLLPEQDRTILTRYLRRFYTDLGTMTSRPQLPLYDQLRGAAVGIVPVGARSQDYGSPARR